MDRELLLAGLKKYIECHYISEEKEDHVKRSAKRESMCGGRARMSEPAQSEFTFSMAAASSVPQFWEVEADDSIDLEALKDRASHIEDSFGAYLLYLMESKGIRPVDVQNCGWISKHIFTKINRDPDGYQPGKKTALQMCVGLELNLDESRDFIARAGYAFSPSKLEDIIWQFGIENHLDIFDVSDLLEEYGFESVIGF